MDESIFTSPLEVNLNKLIKEQFASWNTKIQQFLKFTDSKDYKRVFNYLKLICSGHGIGNGEDRVIWFI